MEHGGRRVFKAKGAGLAPTGKDWSSNPRSRLGKLLLANSRASGQHSGLLAIVVSKLE